MRFLPRSFLAALLCSFVLPLSGCSAGEEPPVNTMVPMTLRVTLDLKHAAQPLGTSLLDSPGNAVGSDTDDDGGKVQFLTPTGFRVAFRSLAIVGTNGFRKDIVEKKATLAESRLVDLANPFELKDMSVDLSDTLQLEADIYFYELDLPLYGEPAHVRIYLSDDDFAAEGNLGHHQGDVTIVPTASTQVQALGEKWVRNGKPWTGDELAADRSGQSGAAGADLETGHVRGLFGDTGLWNETRFNQGANRDILSISLRFPQIAETVVGGFIDLKFPLKNVWYFEDFDHDGEFGPCLPANGTEPTDACHEDAEWAPLLPAPTLSLLAW